MSRSAIAALVALGLAACSTEETWQSPDPHLERMLVQPKLMPYGETPVLPNGMAMQWPPPGTIPALALGGRPGEMPGRMPGAAPGSGDLRGSSNSAFPSVITRELLTRGQSRFEIFCSACHGIAGDGDSVVATKVQLRRPPTLIAPPIADYSQEQIYERIYDGYGLMASYRPELPDGDLWATAAYVKALQISRRYPIDKLPPEIRAELSRRAP